MSWFVLILAGAAEITWAIALKYTDGFHNIIPTVITALAYIGSLLLLEAAVKKLPLGTAYAVWTGIGIIGTTVLGRLLFNEPLSVPRLMCIFMILAGIAGLKLLT